jgi:hypothetical protein
VWCAHSNWQSHLRRFVFCVGSLIDRTRNASVCVRRERGLFRLVVFGPCVVCVALSFGRPLLPCPAVGVTHRGRSFRKFCCTLPPLCSGLPWGVRASERPCTWLPWPLHPAAARRLLHSCASKHRLTPSCRDTHFTGVPVPGQLSRPSIMGGGLRVCVPACSHYYINRPSFRGALDWFVLHGCVTTPPPPREKMVALAFFLRYSVQQFRLINACSVAPWLFWGAAHVCCQQCTCVLCESQANSQSGCRTMYNV